MLIEKIVTTTKVQELDITEATLLSIEEYKKYKDLIPGINGIWWLRSQGYSAYTAACVYGGDLRDQYVLNYLGVRPVLIISNSNLQIGDKFKFADCTFTVINEKYALCDDIVGRCHFREDGKAKDANDYKASNVKQYIDKWFNEQIKEK